MKKGIFLISICLLIGFSSPAIAGNIVAWGIDPNGWMAIDNNEYVAIGGGPHHNLAIKEDGSLMGWTLYPNGNNFGECDVPDGNDYIKVAAGNYHSVALKADGSIVCWGNNQSGQTDSPVGDFVDIAAGSTTSLAIASDGSIVAWGYQYEGVPVGNDFVGIAVGTGARVAVKSDGSLVVWGGNNQYGVLDIPDGNDFIKAAVGRYYGIALRDDGSLVGWGWDDRGQATPPAGNDYTDIDCGRYHGLAIKDDGTVAAWGANDFNQCEVPAGTDYVAIVGGDDHSMALTGGESVFLTIQADANCITPPKGQHEYYLGQRVVVQASRCPDCPDVYDFSHWSGNVSEPNSPVITMVMDANQTITGNFVVDERECGDECHPIVEGDLNEDCYIDFNDFNLFCKKWLLCTHPDCD